MNKWMAAAFLLCSQMQAEECGDRFWIDADYLFWKIQNSLESAPLVVGGPTFLVPTPVLGSPGTSVVLGGKDIDTGWRSGARVSFGYCFDRDYRYAAEAGYFILPNVTTKHSVSSDGQLSSAVLVAPFYNVVTDEEDSAAIAYPLLEFQGTATLKVVNEMQGAEMNLLAAYRKTKFVGLAGFRYWNFNEHLTFATNSPYIPPHVVDTYTTKDKFSVRNNFFGGQLGLAWQNSWRSFSILAKGKEQSILFSSSRFQ